MAFEDYTVDEFMKAWFKKDRTVMDEDVFNEVFCEYIDVAQLFDTDEFEKVAYVHYLVGRKNTISLSIQAQKDFLTYFGFPCVAKFDIFQKYGHVVRWKEDAEDFLNSLKRIEIKEKKYVSDLERSLKDLKDFREKKNKGKEEDSVQQTRPSFIRTLNVLGKCGYKIEKKETSVEELAYMIRQQKEDNEIIKSKY